MGTGARHFSKFDVFIIPCNYYRIEQSFDSPKICSQKSEKRLNQPRQA